jgi:hypothetical protein
VRERQKNVIKKKNEYLPNISEQAGFRHNDICGGDDFRLVFVNQNAD